MKKIFFVLLTFILATIGKAQYSPVIKDYEVGFGSHVYVESDSVIVALSNGNVNFYNTMTLSSRSFNINTGFNYSITKVEDNNYLIVGERKIIKINKKGEVLLDTSYSGIGGYDCIYLKDASYVIGNYQSLYKINLNGDTLWKRNHGIYDLAIGKSDYFFVTNQAKILKISNSGKTIWEKDLSGIFYETHEILELSNGELFVSGRSSNLREVLVSKFNSNGDEVWTKTFGFGISGNCCPFWFNVSMAQVENGIIFTTTTDKEKKSWLIKKISLSGNEIWEESISDNYIEGHNTIAVNKNKIYIVGTRFIANTYIMSMAILEDDKITGLGRDKGILNDKVVLFPNPVKNKIKINTEKLNCIKIEIIKANGQIVISEGISPVGNLEINCSHLEKGIYFLKVYGEKNVFMNKFIKE